MSSFYFGDDDGQTLLNIRKRASNAPPPINTAATTSTPSVGTPITRLSSRVTDFSNLDEVLMFPSENSHAYSYAHLSPNSLALRLNVLKRSLEILNERPDWLKLMQSGPDEATGDRLLDVKPDELKKAPPRSLLARDDHKLRANASSAALSALFRPKMSRSESTPMHRVFTDPETLHSSELAKRSDRRDASGLSQVEDLKKPLPGFSKAAEASFDPPRRKRRSSDPESSEKSAESAESAEKSAESSEKSAEFSKNSGLSENSALNESQESTDKGQEKEDDFFTDELKDVIELLEQDPTLLSSKSGIAATLHDLSLSSATDDAQRKQNLLKTKLLFALATPFVESSGTTSSFLGEAGPTAGLNPLPSNLQLASMQPRQSSAGLNTLSKPSAASGPNRPFHSFSAGKHTSPQSIVTVEADFPWSFKAANDLACLMFGVSKNMIKNVTLIDLIAPQFREFVTEKMTRAIASRHSEKNIIFAGEIIAIARYSEGDFAWTSIWAQKKGNLIICMFEQITCDAFDLTLSADAEASTPNYSISHIDEVAGKLVSKLDAFGITDPAELSQSLAADLGAGGPSSDTYDSEMLNRKRYYTIQLGGEDNIPCALTSYPVEKDPQRTEIRVKVHSMPYIAGMFVVDFSTLEVMSCNKAIVKNLFGASYGDVLNSPIDKIIPNFSAILHAGLQDGGFSIVSGLVLPEHFFRKYDAKLKAGEHFEPEFLGSRGIDGLHRDGHTLHLDVQLRVLRPDVFVLWVTYSRHTNKNIHRHVSKLSSEVSEITSPRQRSSRSSVNLPSQLKLFPEHESDILDLGADPEVSRHSSTRKPKRASTFAVPITYIADAGTAPGSRVVSFSDSVASHEPMSAAPTSAESDTTASSHYYRNFSEQEILDVETRELEEKQAKSKFWPTRIGEKKRSKKYDEFRVLKKMGEGAYGKVVLAEHKQDAEYRVIIKCIDKQRILVDTWVRDRQLGTIPSEIQIMATLNHEPHPNIMRIVDYFEDPDYYYLETPIFGNPPAIDLFDYIEIKSDMSELDCQLIFKQVTSAVYHLHKHGIVHRDIKDENIIVNEFGVVKLIDFGSAGYVKSGPFDVFVGTIDYASPEVLRGEKYEGKPQDIWALGVLLYTMIYKENPFYNVDEIMEADLRLPYTVSEALSDLIQRILVRDVATRPTITDVAEHAWLEAV